MSDTSNKTSPVTVSLNDLKNGSIPLDLLHAAFGPSSLGILVVRDLPPHYHRLRRQVLGASSLLGRLAQRGRLADLESPASKYLTGWSLGREKLKDNRPDDLKGSYYFNCGEFYQHASASEANGVNGVDGANDVDGANGVNGVGGANGANGVDGENGANGMNGANGANGVMNNANGVNGESGTQEAQAKEARHKAYDFPEYTHPNLWPGEDLIPGFQGACAELATLIIDVAALVARACDRFALEYVEGYGGMSTGGSRYLERVVRTSLTTKARLLHYFPVEARGGAAESDRGESAEQEEDDDWCATHLDHGCLTGLTSALYIDSNTEEQLEREQETRVASRRAETEPTLDWLASRLSEPDGEIPAADLHDQSAGLYILSRAGEVTKVAIPRDCIAFQTGEALEKITDGRFKAVPHYVRGVKGGKDSRSIARNTLAVFTQPNLWETVDRERGLDFAAFSKEIVERNY